MSTVAQLISDVDQFLAAIELSATSGLETGAAALQSAAQATTAYQDDTGATRASTVAFVVHPEADGASQVRAALHAGDRKNPGETQLATLDDGEAETARVILTAMMRYDVFLETARAGAHAFLGPTLEQEAPQLAEAAFAAIAAHFSGGQP